MIKRLWCNKIFLAGFIVFVLGCMPLILIMLAAFLGLTSDPNPNPVIFGILASFAVWPALILMGIGLYRAGKWPDRG